MAEPTGFEPATSDVTGRRSNQLNYDSASDSKTAAYEAPYVGQTPQPGNYTSDLSKKSNSISEGVCRCWAESRDRRSVEFCYPPNAVVKTRYSRTSLIYSNEVSLSRKLGRPENGRPYGSSLITTDYSPLGGLCSEVL